MIFKKNFLKDVRRDPEIGLLLIPVGLIFFVAGYKASHEWNKDPLKRRNLVVSHSIVPWEKDKKTQDYQLYGEHFDKLKENYGKNPVHLSELNIRMTKDNINSLRDKFEIEDGYPF